MILTKSWLTPKYALLPWLNFYQSQYQFGKDREKDVIFTAKGKESNFKDLVQLEAKSHPKLR